MNKEATRVLVVDDSAVTRRWLSDLIEAESDLTVCGQAHHGAEAVEKVHLLTPDVVTLDLDMPVLDGLSALTQIMAQRPTPVLIISVHTTENAPQTLQALDRGAVDCIAKPSVLGGPGLEFEKESILEGVRIAAGSRPISSFSPPPKRSTRMVPDADRVARKVVAIGASTGGPQAVGAVIAALPADLDAAVLVVQHLPDVFVESFASRLDSQTDLSVELPRDGDLLLPGRVYVAPAKHHLFLTALEGRIRLRLDSNLRGRMLQPSVGELFSSLLDVDLERIVAVMLTGMGDDGALEMRELKMKGAHTLAQDEASSVVYGMPRVALEVGAVDQVVGLSEMARQITENI